jgi:peptidoglycan/LPS O-acetylase OafA/YrhL
MMVCRLFSQQAAGVRPAGLSIKTASNICLVSTVVPSLMSARLVDRPTGPQFGLISLLKMVAAQLIVLHHLAFYGPMSDHVRPVAPGLIDWLSGDARIAVQAFLVIGGFLAAKSLCSTGNVSHIGNPLGTIWRRYLKLAPPFMVATVITIAAYAWAGMWMTHDSISPLPGLVQLALHAVLAQDILGYESISVGAWYVAIDMQLFAFFTLMLWLTRRLAAQRRVSWLVPAVVIACMSASLFYFNLDSSWDSWALYFFGSYGLGILAWWAGDPWRRPSGTALLHLAMLLPTFLALMLDFRGRIAVALVIAYCLVLLGRARLPGIERRVPFVHLLGQISYSQFLIHFPVCLVINAGFTRFFPETAFVQGVGMLLAWGASIGAGVLFHQWVEVPLQRLVSGDRTVEVRGGLERV